MKTVYFFTFFIFVITCTSFGQREYRIPVQNSKSGVLTLKDFNGNLPIEGYNGNEIILTSDMRNSSPDRAKGMQAIYAKGTDNTGMGILLEKSDNKVSLECLLPITKSAKYTIKVPYNFSVKVDKDCSRHGTVTASNIQGETEIKNCHGIRLRNISGPVVLSTISGDIDLQFDNIPRNQLISINSVSGDIDITLPERASVDVEMRTVTGDMYSDFNLQSEKKSLQQIGGNSIKAILNGGGTDLKITNVSGSIYLRKKR